MAILMGNGNMTTNHWVPKFVHQPGNFVEKTRHRGKGTRPGLQSDFSTSLFEIQLVHLPLWVKALEPPNFQQDIP